MERIIYTEKEFPWHEFLLKTLDWPFLLFVTLIVLIFVFRNDIKKILNKAKITIKYGDHIIELADLPDQLDKDLDPIKERLDLIELQLSSLRDASNTAEIKDKKPTENINQTSPPENEQSKNRTVIHSFKSNRYRYRSLKGLMASTGLSEEEIKQVIESDPRIGVTTNRDGRVLYFNKQKETTKNTSYKLGRTARHKTFNRPANSKE